MNKLPKVDFYGATVDEVIGWQYQFNGPEF